MNGYKKLFTIYPNIKSAKPTSLQNKELPIQTFTVISNVHSDDGEMSDSRSKRDSESEFHSFSKLSLSSRFEI